MMIQVPQLPGFKDPIHDAQTTFRSLLEALANPGSKCQITASLKAPVGLSPACAAACLTLLDLETQVWLQPTLEEDVKNWLLFHTGCRFTTEPQTANFAITQILHDPPSPPYQGGNKNQKLASPLTKGGLRGVNNDSGARDEIINNYQFMPSLSAFNQGTDEEPEASTTLLIQVENFESGHSVKLTGPGIQSERVLTVKGLSSRFWEDLAKNVRNYPLGVDIFLFTTDTVVGLPRTTKVMN